MAERPGKRKRPPLNYDKCRFCRKAKKACIPVQRTWPQKCQRCTELELECSENSRAAGAPTPIPPQPNNQAIDSQLIRDISLRATWLGRLNSYHRALEAALDTQKELFPSWDERHLFIAERHIELETDSYFNDVLPKILISNNPLAGFLAQIPIGVTFPQYLLSTQICPTTVDRLRENGDMSAALATQEILLLSFSGRERGLEYNNELSKYCDVFQETTTRVQTTLGREIPAVPPLHYSLLLGKARNVHWIEGQIFPNMSRFISMKDYFGRSLIHVALDLDIRGSASLYNRLKEFIAAADIWGRRPIHVACSRNSQYPAAYILDITTDYDVRDRWGRTALHYASRGGNEYATRWMIERGAKIDHVDLDGRSPIIWAIEHGHTSIAELLLKSGADANAQFSGGKVALSLAAKRGHTETVQALLDYGADVHHKHKFSGTTALHLAASRGHNSTVEVLLRNGAGVNERDCSGRTALMIAASDGKIAIVQELLKYGADVHHKHKFGGATALHLAASRGHNSTVEVLLRNGAGVNERDDCIGRTALMIAASDGKIAIARELLKYGADVDLVSRHGRTALWFASLNGSICIVKLLIKHGADPHTKFHGT